jgi:hypothetical protein
MTLRCGWGRVDGTGLTVTLLARQAGLCLRGEADLLSLDTLREAIAALPADAGEVHLELAELSFIDVCSARELIALAHRPARPRLIFHQPPYSLTLLISLLGPDCRQIPAPAGRRTGDSATASIQAACRQRNEGDAHAEDQPIQPAASR